MTTEAPYSDALQTDQPYTNHKPTAQATATSAVDGDPSVEEIAEARVAVATPGAPATPVAAAPAAPPEAPARCRSSTVKLVLMLGSMAALGALTTDMYLPSLPEVVVDLAAGETSVQFTITATLLGGAIGQLLIGPLSDRYGRRTPVLVGVSVHVVASLLCLLAPSVVPLIVLRVIQGIGNASAGVVAVAVIRDRLAGAEASAMLSRLMLVIGVAPLLAPTVGGVIASIWHWRAVFVALALYGVILALIVWKFLPESLPAEKRIRSNRAVVGSYRVLLRDPQFLALALLPGLAMAALFAYVSGSPFVIRDGYGLSEQQFAILFAVNGLGLVGGAQLNAALVRRFAPIRIMRLALPLSVATSVVLLIMAATGTGGLIGLCIPLWLMLAINSLIPPNASALALTRHGERAGAAAALIGCSQSGVAGVVAPLVGLLGADATGMSVVIVGAMVVAFGVLALGTPAYRRGGWSV